MSAITIVLGAGFSQSLHIDGTRRITELVDEQLKSRHGEDYTKLRDRLKARFVDRYNFEVLAAALEACEPFGKPTAFADPYLSVVPQVTVLREDLTVELARNMYEILMSTVMEAVSVDWTLTIKSERRNQIQKCFDAIEKPYNAIDIATLNYDLGAEGFHPDYQDGFIGSGERQYFDPAVFLQSESRVRIAHVHGSIAYGIEEPPKFVKMTGSLQPRRVALWVQRTDGTFWSGVITGNDKPGKLAMPPYSVYFPWLADKLLRSTRLLIIGYGIGDYHLNVSLLTALRFHAKRDIRCVIVDCFDPDSGNLPDSLGLYAYATGKDSALTPEEQKAIQFKDGTARSEGAMLVHTGFPLTDTQLDEVGGFLSS